MIVKFIKRKKAKKENKAKFERPTKLAQSKFVFLVITHVCSFSKDWDLVEYF